MPPPPPPPLSPLTLDMSATAADVVLRLFEEEGYEYADEASVHESLRCAITFEPLISPVVTPCDHTFSRDALKQEMTRQRAMTRTAPARCPLCKATFCQADLKPVSRLVISILDSLIVICPFATDSTPCTWRGKRDSAVAHLRHDCQRARTACPHGHQLCGDLMAKGDLPKHFETCTHVPIPCPHCTDMVTRTSLTPPQGYHTQICALWPTGCPDCAATMPRFELDGHRGQCPQRPTKCSHVDWGCTFQSGRRTVHEHQRSCVYVVNEKHFYTYIQRVRPTFGPADKLAIAEAIFSALREGDAKVEAERKRVGQLTLKISQLEAELARAKGATPAPGAQDTNNDRISVDAIVTRTEDLVVSPAEAIRVELPSPNLTLSQVTSTTSTETSAKKAKTKSFFSAVKRELSAGPQRAHPGLF